MRTWEKAVVIIVAAVLAIAIGILGQPILDTLSEMLIDALDEVEEAVQ